MRLFILTNKRRPVRSVRVLRDKLRELGHTVHTGTAVPLDTRFVIRWRNTQYVNLHGAQEINSADAIRKASNKFGALKAMEEGGVRIPPCSRDWRDIERDSETIILGRDAYHTKGTDIVAYKPGEGVPCGRHHYVKALIPNKEYRYHIAFGKIILPTVKITVDGQYQSSDIIKNHQNGRWRQVVCSAVRPWIENQALKAVELMGLEFGAADVVFYNKHAYVLEVNTAPNIAVPNRVAAYAKAIDEYIRR